MKFIRALSLIIASVVTFSDAAHADDRLSVDQVRSALADATFDCAMSGGVTFRLYFPEDNSGDEVEYRFRLQSETQRRPMTYVFEDEVITSVRDGEERVFYDLGGGDLRIARPGEDGATCRRDQ